MCIRDRDKANPIATILSAAMMLRYSFNLSAEADCMEAAVSQVLAAGLRTADILGTGRGAPLGCTAMTDAILAAI